MRFRWLNFALIAFFLISVVSCSLRSDEQAFVSDLDVIDALILQNDVDGAVKELRKAEKKAFNSFSYLGLFRRYQQLGVIDRAEKIIQKAHSKFSSNIELIAVYTHFLLRDNRIEDAIKISKDLQGTQYESLYAEAIIKKTMENDSSEKFEELEFVPVYKAAYLSSKNTLWIKNAAVLLSCNKKIREASLLEPDRVFTAQDAYFWGLIQFDCSNFLKAATNFTLAENLILDSKVSKDDLLAEISSLKADSLLSIGEYVDSQRERDYLIATVGYSTDINPETYVNSAFWAKQNNNESERYEYLFNTVTLFPNFIPALLAYGNFAYESSLPSKEGFYEEKLRESGLKTLKMQKYDEIPRVNIEDAISRMDKALLEKDDPLLTVVRLNLEHKKKNLSNAAIVAETWDLLEKKSIGTNLYNPVIMEYALNVFLTTKEDSAAYNLYCKYIKSKYALSANRNFWNQLVEKSEIMDVWECDYGAYFALKSGFVDIARKLYEGLLFARPEYAPEIATAKNYSAVMNLALLYGSTGLKQKSLDLYSSKSGIVDNVIDRAEILYRLACLQNSMSNTAQALRTLDYCVQLDPLNEKARLLLLKLRSER